MFLVHRDYMVWTASRPALPVTQVMAPVTTRLVVVPAHQASLASCVTRPALGGLMAGGVWAPVTAGTEETATMYRGSADARGAGQVKTVPCPAPLANLVQTVSTTATAIMEPAVTLWTVAASVNQATQALGARTFVLRAILDRTVTRPAGARVRPTSVTPHWAVSASQGSKEQTALPQCLGLLAGPRKPPILDR